MSNWKKNLKIVTLKILKTFHLKVKLKQSWSLKIVALKNKTKKKIKSLAADKGKWYFGKKLSD